MNQDIEVLIHFDKIETKHSVQIWCIMSYLLETFDGCCEIASIMVETRQKDSYVANQFAITDLKILQSMADSINDNVCFISFDCQTLKHQRVVGMYACITHSNALTQPMIKDEQKIAITISWQAWSAKQNFILEKILSLCVADSISYIAIDRVNVAPKSIYTANLRLFSLTAKDFDEEKVIPGIYWGQYLSVNMLNEEMVEQIKLNYAPELTYILKKEKTCGLWLQTSTALDNDTMEQHMRLYSIFDKNTYTIDNETVKKYRKLQPWLFDRYPL